MEHKETLCRVTLKDPMRRAKRVSWGGDTHRFLGLETITRSGRVKMVKRREKMWHFW